MAVYYENQEPGLGDYFLDHMELEFSVLCRTAGSHRLREGFNRFVTRGFHHLIFYRVEAGQPVVYAVLDGRRDPAYNSRQLRRPF